MNDQEMNVELYSNEDKEVRADAAYKQTIFKVVHFVPDWVKKDNSFNLN